MHTSLAALVSFTRNGKPRYNLHTLPVREEITIDMTVGMAPHGNFTEDYTEDPGYRYSLGKRLAHALHTHASSQGLAARTLFRKPYEVLTIWIVERDA